MVKIFHLLTHVLLLLLLLILMAASLTALGLYQSSDDGQSWSLIFGNRIITGAQPHPFVENEMVRNQIPFS